MAEKTLYASVYMALDLKSKRDSTYLTFGRDSRWVDDTNPPRIEEDSKVKELDEVQGYKHVKRFSVARPLKSNETEENSEYPVVTYNGSQWALIPDDRAYEEEARWVYIEAELLSSEYPHKEYRQVGVRVGVEPKQGKVKPNLEPNDIRDPGVLMYYENREPQRRTTSVYVLEQFILKV